MTQRQAADIFIAHGGVVTRVHRTGEKEFSHPALARPIRVNGRKKDCPAILRLACLRLLGVRSLP